MPDITSIIITILSSSVIASIVNAIANRSRAKADTTSVLVEKALQTNEEIDKRFHKLYETLKKDYEDKCLECDKYEKKLAECQEKNSYYVSLLIQHGISFRRFDE